MNKQFKIKSAVLILCLGSVTGCGDLRGIDMQQAPQDAFASTSTSLQNSDDPNYSCPNNPNVVPYRAGEEYDSNLNGTDQYRVCSNRNSNYSIRIFGRPSDLSEKVCVFPAQAYSKTNVWFKPDQNLQPMVGCQGAVRTDGTYSVDFEFDKTNFNAVYIVLEKNVDQMKVCLRTSFYNCPNYSFGIFR